MLPIYTLKDIVEASVVEAALKDAGIKFIIRTFEDRAYDGIYIAQKGYGQVLVEEEDAEEARKIIEGLSKT